MYNRQGYPMGEYAGNSGKRMAPDVPPSSSSKDEDQSAQALKRPRLVWTPQLHKRFEDAVNQLGIKHAVPKTIMQVWKRKPWAVIPLHLLLFAPSFLPRSTALSASRADCQASLQPCFRVRITPRDAGPSTCRVMCSDMRAELWSAVWVAGRSFVWM